MNLAGTQALLYPLTTGANDNPTLTQGAPTNFFANTLPDRTAGGLANYVPCAILTIKATLTQTSASSGTNINYDKLPTILIDSVNWSNCWHGTVISSNFVKGAHLNAIEYINGGFRYIERKRGAVSATAAAYPIELTVPLFPSSSRLGTLESDTSPLAAMLSGSTITINTAPASVLAAFSTGASLSNISARLSVALVPRNELVLCTPIETVLHSVVAGGSSDQIQIRGFGCDSTLTGIQRKGGVVHLGELTSVNGQGGGFLAENVTQFNMPWRSQQTIYQIEGYVNNAFFGQQGPNRPQVFPSIVGAGDSEMASFPYANQNFQGESTVGATGIGLKGLLEFPIIYPGTNLRLSDLQTADGDKEYYLTVTGGFGTNHLLLGMYAKAWSPTTINAFVDLVTRGGSGSLAAHVLGADKYKAATIRQRLPKTKTIVTDDNLAYLPWQLSAAA